MPSTQGGWWGVGILDLVWETHRRAIAPALIIVYTRERMYSWMTTGLDRYRYMLEGKARIWRDGLNGLDRGSGR